MKCGEQVSVEWCMNQEAQNQQTIRRATLADLERIGEINREETIAIEYRCELAEDGKSIHLLETPFDPPKHRPHWSNEGIQQRAAWWRRTLENDGVGFVTESADRLTGIAILSAEKHDKTAELVSLFVDKDHRACGLGTLLLQQIENEARSRSIVSLYVGSNENANSLGFYQRMGYKIVCLMDASDIWLPGLETTIILAKKL